MRVKVARFTEGCLYAIALVAAYDYLAGPYGYGVPILARGLLYFGGAALLLMHVAIQVAGGKAWRFGKIGPITMKDNWGWYWIIALLLGALAVAVFVMGVVLLKRGRFDW